MDDSRQVECELFVSCLAGLEKQLAAELKAMRAHRVRPLGGGVSLYANVEGALRICLWSRLASRVMLVCGRANAGDANLLYEGVRRMPWEEICAPGATLAVRAHGTNDELRNTKFAALKVKDAICDRLRERCGSRPNVDAETPDILIDVRIRENRATISFDLSGEPLNKRSYLRLEDGPEAALSCSYAAGLLALAGWSGASSAAREGCFVDPACGDGALLLEAAALACDLAPGLTREKWGFFAWSAFDARIWERLLDEADARFEEGLATTSAPDFSHARFVGASASSPGIARVRAYAKRAGLSRVVSIEARDVSGGADAIACRVARNSHLVPGAFLVASLLRAGEAAVDAAPLADASAFARAAAAAPAQSVFAVAGDDGAVSCRFPESGTTSFALGQGRVKVSASVFTLPPVKSSFISIPDSFGGADLRVAVQEPTSDQFACRLRKNAKERRKWAHREGVSCYRVYDADLPDYNVAIDVYEGALDAEGTTFLHIAEYQAPSSVDAGRARRRFEDAVAIASVVLGVRPEHVFCKVRRRSRGGGQYSSAERRSFVAWTQEDGYVFELDLAGYLDTGLFLDHRLTRELVGSKAAGARFLNLFAYTGAATVHAAGAGAVETTTVDLSATYLDWARRNMELNGFDGPEHSFVRSDVMDFITQTRRSPLRYDLIFVDPPTFSNSKAMGRRTWDVQRDHVELLIGVSRLLAKGGLALFSCNLRTFKPDVEALAKYGVALEDITETTIPHDFERNPKIHKCYVVRLISRK